MLSIYLFSVPNLIPLIRKDKSYLSSTSKNFFKLSSVTLHLKPIFRALIFPSRKYARTVLSLSLNIVTKSSTSYNFVLTIAIITITPQNIITFLILICLVKIRFNYPSTIYRHFRGYFLTPE